LFDKGLDARALRESKIAAVGATTAEVLKSYGIQADLLPEEFTGEGLARALIEKGVADNRILIPRALKAREILPETLRDAGAEVVVAPVYQNLQPKGNEKYLRKLFTEKQIDVITFTSSSTVNNFLDMLHAGDEVELKQLLAGVTVAAIGPITAKTAQKNGLAINIQPEAYTIPALVDSILEYFKTRV